LICDRLDRSELLLPRLVPARPEGARQDSDNPAGHDRTEDRGSNAAERPKNWLVNVATPMSDIATVFCVMIPAYLMQRPTPIPTTAM
jgi:hypothetical protein